MRFLRAGDDGLLVELSDLETVLALLAHLQDRPPPGLQEAVPAARTLMLRFDPAETDPDRLADRMRGQDLRSGEIRAGQLHEIPVRYDGEDLPGIAAHLGWSVAEVIRRHSAAEFTVAFTGFAPGFAYLTCSDPGFDLPRRPSPRLRIPAGSLALAGRFSGIYPSDSPGGWQLLGRTGVAMWDLSRPRPALLAPGDRVVFRDLARGGFVPSVAGKVNPPPRSAPSDNGPVVLTVLHSDRPASYQDAGRPGQVAQGIGCSGALDRGAFRRVNRLLGNPPGTPALELTFGGMALRAEAAVTLALTGAPCPMLLTRPGGLRLDLAPDLPHALDAGDRLEIGLPARGLVSYLGLRGGLAVDRVLGSASRDTLSGIGPEPVGAGAQLRGAGGKAGPVTFDTPLPGLPAAGGITEIDILMGPRDDWFTSAGLARLTGQDWLVTPETGRSGMRLSAAEPLERRDSAELLSEATVAGAIQVPHNGQPVLFLADHPLTGGYPVIACVARHHLDLVAQVPPGGFLRFRPRSKGAAS